MVLLPFREQVVKKQDTGWTWFHHIPSRTRRMRFQKGEQGSEPPTDILRATVYQKHSHWICSGYHHQPSTHNSTTPISLREIIDQLPDSIKWCADHFWASDNGDTIAEAIRQGTAVALSDGSYKDQRGTSAWVIEADQEIGRIKGWNMVPGYQDDHSSYRSELTGILSILVFLHEI